MLHHSLKEEISFPFSNTADAQENSACLISAACFVCAEPRSVSEQREKKKKTVSKWPRARTDNTMINYLRDRFLFPHYNGSLAELGERTCVTLTFLLLRTDLTSEELMFQIQLMSNEDRKTNKDYVWAKDNPPPQKKKKNGVIRWLFWQTGQGRNVGQQNSLVGVKLPIGLTPQASNRWCFNNKYLGKAPLNWITLV